MPWKQVQAGASAFDVARRALVVGCGGNGRTSRCSAFQSRITLILMPSTLYCTCASTLSTSVLDAKAERKQKPVDPSSLARKVFGLLMSIFSAVENSI